MTGKDSSPHLTALQQMEAALDAHRRTRAPAGATEHARAEAGSRRFTLRWPNWQRPSWLPLFDPRILLGRGHPILRNVAITIGVLVSVVLIGGGLLWWRLLSGPIAL